jgi:hypothetical protein
MQIIPKHFYALVIPGERVATEVPSVSLQKAQTDLSDAPKGYRLVEQLPQTTRGQISSRRSLDLGVEHYEVVSPSQ